jgi:hypothetical protein
MSKRKVVISWIVCYHFVYNKDAIANFNKDYISTGIFPKKLEKRLLVQRKSDTLVIIMIFILQQKKKQSNR